MAIGTYALLQNAIADHLAREDLAEFIPDFIQLAENWLNYGSADTAPLRVREMETTATLTPTDGDCTVPDDFLQTISAREDGYGILSYVTPQAFDALYPVRFGGNGMHYTIVGDTLKTAPDVSNDIILTYYQALPELSVEGNTTNWLLQKSPGIYLRASLAQAAEFIKNDAEAAKQASMAQALMAGLNRSDMVGRYARAGLTIAGCTP
jgi:hypothetical protein